MPINKQSTEPEMTHYPEHLVGLLADPTRLWVVAQTALRPISRPVLAGLAVTELRINDRDVQAAIQKLVDGGLVAVLPDGRLTTTEQPFRQATLWANKNLDPNADKSLRQKKYVYKGALVAIPERDDDLQLVLEVISRSIPAGVRLPERQVNMLLLEWHTDYASLRRLLVDHRWLDRAGGMYWRTADDGRPLAGEEQ